MPYPEMMIYGMRAELAGLGIEETKTTEAVEDAVKNTDGTVMVVVNSVCGCAAGGVRPGIAMALANSQNKPERSITVFAGADIDATDTARAHLQRSPVCARPDAERRHQADARDHDAPVHPPTSFPWRAPRCNRWLP